MTIEIEKVCDGLFVFEQERINYDGSIESNRAIIDMFDKINNPKDLLDTMEIAIKKLLKDSRKVVCEQRVSPKLKKHYDKYSILDQVKTYAERALYHLFEARKYLETDKTALGIVATGYMMENYWRGVMHSKKIKDPILREKAQGRGRSLGGYKKAEQTIYCREKLPLIAQEIWSKNPAMKVSAIVQYLLKNHREACTDTEGKVIGASSIRKFVKKAKPQK